jgi:hypothetical protein
MLTHNNRLAPYVGNFISSTHGESFDGILLPLPGTITRQERHQPDNDKQTIHDRHVYMQDEKQFYHMQRPKIRLFKSIKHESSGRKNKQLLIHKLYQKKTPSQFFCLICGMVACTWSFVVHLFAE